MTGHPERRAFLAAGGGLLAGGIAGCAERLGWGAADVGVPDRTLVGMPFPVRMTAQTDVESLRLSATDGLGREFAQTVDVGDLAEGETIPAHRYADVDPASYTQTKGSDESVTDGLGGEGPPRMLLQLLQPVDPGNPHNFATVDRYDEFVTEHGVTLTLHGGGETIGSATGRRLTMDPDVADQQIAHEELVGRVARPPGEGPSPGVVVLHGSSAVDLYGWSRRLASHGYAVLTLKYFAELGLPDTLDDVPLEYFDRSVEWFAGREAVLGDRIGFVGISRGVEPALLTAANYDGRTVAVGYGGSGIAFFGLTALGGAGEGVFVEPAGWEAAWTRDGEPIASAEAVQRAARSVGVANPEDLGEAAIPVEDVDGPVVLYAGDDDRVWPARAYSAYVSRRLEHFDFEHPYSVVVYDEAGHAFYAPYDDYSGRLSGDGYGGTPSTNARAAADSWVRTLDYLEAGLKEE